MPTFSTSLPYVNQNHTNISAEAQNSQKHHSLTRNTPFQSIPSNEYENSKLGAANNDQTSSANSF